MDIYNNAISQVVQFAEKKVADLKAQKDANIRLKQETYKRETTDKRVADIAKIRDEDLAKLKAKYDEDVEAIKLAFDNKRAELIETGNSLVKAEEEVRFEKGVEAIMNGIKLLKGEDK